MSTTGWGLIWSERGEFGSIWFSANCACNLNVITDCNACHWRIAGLKWVYFMHKVRSLLHFLTWSLCGSFNKKIQKHFLVKWILNWYLQRMQKLNGAWSYLVISDPIWSMVVSDHIWSCLVMSDHIWSCLRLYFLNNVLTWTLVERDATKWWIKCSAVKSGGSEAAAVEGSRRESHTLLLRRCDELRKNLVTHLRKNCSPASAACWLQTTYKNNQMMTCQPCRNEYVWGPLTNHM